MSWFPAPACVSILLDANRVAPQRNHASDGIIGDASHSASVSDHNPDTDGCVHACDITNDPAHGFDAWHWANVVADRIRSGAETRVKYLVSNDGSKDVIFNPSVAMSWRQNGSVKQEHRSHLHVSIKYTDAAEKDQSRFFVGTAGAQTPGDIVEQKDIDAIVSGLDTKLNRVIGTLQTNLRDATASITKAVALADTNSMTPAQADALAKQVADEVSEQMAAEVAAEFAERLTA